MLRRVSIAGSAGICVGALAGLATALADFGAHWLFMESGPDRVALFARLVYLQPAASALLFGCAGLWIAACLPLSAAASRRFGVRERQALACLLSVPLLVPLGAVARLLFTGGKMSRLPAQPLAVGLTFLALAALCALSCAFGLRLWETSRQADRPAFRRALLAAAGGAYLASKLNQYALPRLYDYLHAMLAGLTLAGFALAILMLGTRLLARRRVPAWLAHTAGPLLLGSTLLLGRAGLHALDQNQNVRVALLSPNMPHARALLLSIAPLLPRVDRQSAALAELRAAAARRKRAAAVSGKGLPVIEDAHVLMITVDALRADRLGIHGYKRNVTPELDALARRGVSFERAYAQAPHSSYSLCSMMTSEYLHETLELGQPAPKATLPGVLAAAGYHSAAFYTQGIFHTEGEQLQIYRDSAFGFALHEHQDRPAEDMTDRVLAEVDRTLARHEPSTLFWVHYFDVHEPYEATTLGTSDADRYDSELLATDRAIGRLVREVERRVHKPLLVLITADHGEEFHDHGGVYHGSTLYDEQVRVPLILVAPQLPAARVQAPVEVIDVAPTLLGLLGVEPPSSMRGRDLRALALGQPQVDRGPVFSAVIHKKMVVRWPHKLIADLRFGLFELYDLERDPFERDNRADHDPQRLDNLRGEIYAWLDALAKPENGAAIDLTAQALEWGRLGDRRAVQPLAAVLLDERRDPSARAEAARLLGKLADPSSVEDLLRGTRANQRWVAAEAAIALGRLYEPRAAPALRQLIAAEDPGLRSRAAVSLGRLRDRAAVPSLIEALWLAPNTYEREEAVRWLGRLGDVRALDPLINLLPQVHVRHLVVVALGELGDTRAYAPLLDVLARDRNANVRDGVTRGLAMLGDPRAVDAIIPLATDDPALSQPGEALVRLRALESQRIGGADMQRQGQALSGFGRCVAGPLRHDWDFLHRTVCFTTAPQASFRAHLPKDVVEAADGTVVLFSLRRSDTVRTTEVELSIGGTVLSRISVAGGWIEARWTLPPNGLPSGDQRAVIRTTDPAARFEVDHLLVIPRLPAQPSAAGAEPRTG